MDVICVNCGSVFDVRTNSLDNGNKSSGVCINCFIIWLEVFIEYIKAKGDPKNQLPSLKKMLTSKLVERQEGGGDGIL